MTVCTRKNDRYQFLLDAPLTLRNPADDPLQTLCRLLVQQECSRPVSGLASFAPSPSHAIRARPFGRHVMAQWLVNTEFTVMQPHWLTVAGAAEALRSSRIAHLVPVSPISLPKQAPVARGDTIKNSRAVSLPGSTAASADTSLGAHLHGRIGTFVRLENNLHLRY